MFTISKTLLQNTKQNKEDRNLWLQSHLYSRLPFPKPSTPPRSMSLYNLSSFTQAWNLALTARQETVHMEHSKRKDIKQNKHKRILLIWYSTKFTWRNLNCIFCSFCFKTVCSQVDDEHWVEVRTSWLSAPKFFLVTPKGNFRSIWNSSDL